MTIAEKLAQLDEFINQNKWNTSFIASADLAKVCKEYQIVLKALEFYATKRNWGEHSKDFREWYLIESTDRGEKARTAIVQVTK